MIANAERWIGCRQRWSGIRARVEPVPPERDGDIDAPRGVVDVVRCGQTVGPGKRAEDAVAYPECAAGSYPVALDTEGQVGVQAQHLRRPGGVRRSAGRVDHRPAGWDVPVVEDRLADELDLDVAVDALRGPHEDVLGVVVGWGPRVRRHRIRSTSRSDRQRVPDDDPARWRLPRGHQDVGPGFVDPLGRDVDAERAEAERAGFAVEQAAKDAGRVEPRHAQPVDATVRSHQGPGVAVRQEPVVGDRRERRRHRRALTLLAALAAHGTPSSALNHSRRESVRWHHPNRMMNAEVPAVPYRAISGAGVAGCPVSSWWYCASRACSSARRGKRSATIAAPIRIAMIPAR